jgi:sugar transferase EpsL
LKRVFEISVIKFWQTPHHDVRPGMTGWAQVNGRNAISWEEKFRLDLWYVDNWSLWLDIKILAMTMLHVLCRKGINHNATETMPLFTGSMSGDVKG